MISTVQEIKRYERVCKKEDEPFSIRKNPYQIKNSSFQRLIDEQVSGIACLMYPDKFLKKTFKNEFSPKYKSNLATDQKYSEEPAPGFGTAFLIDSKYMLTARHCLVEEDTKRNLLSEKKLKSIPVVFGFEKKRADQTKYNIPKRDVYNIKKILYDDTQMDVALIELNRSVQGGTPLTLDISSRDLLDHSVYMLGHGEGIPLKYTYYAKIVKASAKTLGSDLLAFPGNSGSPVIDSQTNKVIGILIEATEMYKESDEDKKNGVPLHRLYATGRNMDKGCINAMCISINEIMKNALNNLPEHEAGEIIRRSRKITQRSRKK